MTSLGKVIQRKDDVNVPAHGVDDSGEVVEDNVPAQKRKRHAHKAGKSD